jgi:hypothetical protein
VVAPNLPRAYRFLTVGMTRDRSTARTAPLSGARRRCAIGAARSRVLMTMVGQAFRPGWRERPGADRSN